MKSFLTLFAARKNHPPSYKIPVRSTDYQIGEDLFINIFLYDTRREQCMVLDGVDKNKILLILRECVALHIQ